MPRTYLCVPPEEKAEVQAFGAHWDGDSKRWYIDDGEPVAALFSRWLPNAERDATLDAEIDDDFDEEFDIVATDASIAAVTIACRYCHSAIKVICIHCKTGTVRGEPLERFTVSDISAIDESLAEQLLHWPHFRRVLAPDGDAGYFANHCADCGAVQDDMYLHSEPDDPFFDIPHAAPGSIELTALDGTIQLSGDEHFQVD